MPFDSANNHNDQRAAKSSTLNFDQLGTADSAERKSLSFLQIINIERRIKKGLPVDDEERRQYTEILVKLQKFDKDLQSTFAGIAELGRQFEKWYVEQLVPFVNQMLSAYKQMPPKIKTALLALGEQGWYFDGELGFSELWELKARIDAGDDRHVDAILVEHFEGRLPAIEANLVAAFPSREKILRAAFAAHRRGEYELSVPVFLTQSDGVCLSLTDFHLFMNKNKRPEVAQYATHEALNAFTAALLSPLSIVLPINASEKERERQMRTQGQASWIALNRHLVLHGESLDYGTQINSLKAISLINYLVGFLAGRESPLLLNKPEKLGKLQEGS